MSSYFQQWLIAQQENARAVLLLVMVGLSLPAGYSFIRFIPEKYRVISRGIYTGLSFVLFMVLGYFCAI